MCKFLKNRTVKKTLLMTMSLLLMSAMLPDNGASAREQDRFGTYAKASHWGRSDLRAYLNNGLANVTEDGTVSGKNYGMDSTDGAYASDNTSGYAKYFSDAEYEILQPFTYDTAVDETSKYSVTDKLWLPSANYSEGRNQIISWGKDDISSDDQYRKTIEEDKQRIIPISYWNENSASGAFLRSSCYESDDMVLTAVRGKSTGKSKVNKSDVGTAVALKIDLTSVRFASVVTTVGDFGGEGGAKKLEISGSNILGSKTADITEYYGMYLKTFSDCLFSPTALSFDGHNLTVNYSGGVAGQYIVVHVFKEDDVALGTTNYVATKKIVESDTSATIDVRNWELGSLDGYTVKVWMEDGSGSLAKATAPTTLSDYENENHRYLLKQSYYGCVCNESENTFRFSG